MLIKCVEKKKRRKFIRFLFSVDEENTNDWSNVNKVSSETFSFLSLSLPPSLAFPLSEDRFQKKNSLRLEMSAVSTVNENGDATQTNGIRRRQSILTSSDPQTDVFPIDFVLVYDEIQDPELETTINDQNRRQQVRPSELRQNFEEYLRKRQGLVLKHVVSIDKKTSIWN